MAYFFPAAHAFAEGAEVVVDGLVLDGLVVDGFVVVVEVGADDVVVVAVVDVVGVPI